MTTIIFDFFQIIAKKQASENKIKTTVPDAERIFLFFISFTTKLNV